MNRHINMRRWNYPSGFYKCDRGRYPYGVSLRVVAGQSSYPTWDCTGAGHASFRKPAAWDVRYQLDICSWFEIIGDGVPSGGG